MFEVPGVDPVEPQLVIPETPVIIQVPLPLGTAAPVAPVTTALKVMESPTVAEVEGELTTIEDGFAFATFVSAPVALAER